MDELNDLIPEIEDNTVDDHKKLNKKIILKMIEVILSTITVMILIAFNQGKKLFLFDFLSNSTEGDTIQSVISGVAFGYVIYGFLVFILGFSVYLAVLVYQKKMAYTPLKHRYDFYDLLGVVPVFLSIVVILNAFFFSPAIVHGPSMEPTFYEDDAVIIYHLNRHFESQDVIIFDRGDALLIKRLIGLPGDHLKVDLTGVYLNGENLNVEGYETEYHQYDGVIPEGFYFIMGDNHDESNDSRYFGLVEEKDLLGKVIIKF
jgi:signal peptidase I